MTPHAGSAWFHWASLGPSSWAQRRKAILQAEIHGCIDRSQCLNATASQSTSPRRAAAKTLCCHCLHVPWQECLQSLQVPTFGKEPALIEAIANSSSQQVFLFTIVLLSCPVWRCDNLLRSFCSRRQPETQLRYAAGVDA